MRCSIAHYFHNGEMLDLQTLCADDERLPWPARLLNVDLPVPRRAQHRVLKFNRSAAKRLHQSGLDCNTEFLVIESSLQDKGSGGYTIT